MPNIGADSRGCEYHTGVTPRIGFPGILLLFFGGLAIALLAYAICRSLGVPVFSSQMTSALLNDGYWVAGYQWLSHERDWISLRNRFAPVPRKALLQAAGAALVLIAAFQLG